MQQHTQTRVEINSLIQQLNELLDEKDKQAKNDAGNWGHAGDLGHIKEELSNIVNFIK